jgi:SAM-dependent methyltransferase
MTLAEAAAAWDAAPFEPLAATLAPVHDALVERLAPRSGERFLDVGTGTGAVALRAARAGARATGLDIAPRMLAAARARADAEGLPLDLVLAPAERMPFAGASFAVVASAQGVMFALDREAAARELARVCAPGGRLGLSALADTPPGRELLSLVGVRQPSPLAWGRPDEVRRLLGWAFELRFEELSAPLRGDSADGLWRLYVGSCGPLRLAASSRVRAAFIELVEQHALTVPRDFLLVLGTRTTPAASRRRSAAG